MGFNSAFKGLNEESAITFSCNFSLFRSSISPYLNITRVELLDSYSDNHYF